MGGAWPSTGGASVGGAVVAGEAWNVPDDELVLTGGAQPTVKLRQRTARHEARARLRKIIKLSQIVATVARNAVTVDRPPHSRLGKTRAEGQPSAGGTRPSGLRPATQNLFSLCEPRAACNGSHGQIDTA